MFKGGSLIRYKGSTNAIDHYFTVDSLYAVLEAFGGIAKVICDNGSEINLHPTELKFFEEVTT